MFVADDDGSCYTEMYLNDQEIYRRDTEKMKVSDFTFDLPEELIAQDPLEDRSSSRLLTLDKNTGEIGHDVFHNIVNYLKPGDCLVLNNTKVFLQD